MKSLIVFLMLLLVTAPQASAQSKPAIPVVDRVRLAEAFRISETLGDRVWPNWHKAPFAVLLVTPDYEFLMRHPQPSPDFRPLGYDSLLQSSVYFRKRTQSVDFLATFPLVGGISTVVIGEAENTAAKTSTPWVVTILHEHFHQLQDSQPNYYAQISALNLAHGDQTGMWMLNYPFPYRDTRIDRQFSTLGKLLAAALKADHADFPKKLTAYLQARGAFQHLLTPADYRYFSFQLWKEGIARYTEWRVAALAAREYSPSPAFRALKDYTPFRAVAGSLYQKQILLRLLPLHLDTSERLEFYPFGAAEGILLDRANPQWQRRYFSDKFHTADYFRPVK